MARDGDGTVSTPQADGLRFLHTADWHLGHSLHGHDRAFEHRAFLDWLIAIVVEHDVDALLIAGDVFDRGQPPAGALEMWFSFLARLRDATANPSPTQVVVIAGNHDSPSRLTAPSELLESLGAARLVGRVPRTGDGLVDPSRIVVPLRRRRDRSARIAAHALAVPFLRPSDLGPVTSFTPEGDSSDAARTAALYREALASCRTDAPVIALGHMHLVGCQISQLSERPLLLGGEEALPASLFPEGLSYVALGHLHRAQRVGRDDRVRYSGSPIPLSMAEAGYRHQVVLGEVARAGEPAMIQVLGVPRSVQLHRLGPASVDEVEAALRALPPRDETEAVERTPFVEARVVLTEPVPGLRPRLEAAVADRHARLVRIAPEFRGGDGRQLADGVEVERLADLDPMDVFSRRWRQRYEGEPTAELETAFRSLWHEVEAGE